MICFHSKRTQKEPNSPSLGTSASLKVASRMGTPQRRLFVIYQLYCVIFDGFYRVAPALRCGQSRSSRGKDRPFCPLLCPFASSPTSPLPSCSRWQSSFHCIFMMNICIFALILGLHRIDHPFFPLDADAATNSCSLPLFPDSSSLGIEMSAAFIPSKTLSDYNVPPPTIEERLAAYAPNLGHKPKFLETFPPDLSALVVKTLKEIIDEYSPYASDDRESVVNLVPGVSIPQLTKELLKRLPWMRANRSYPNGPSEDVVAHLLSAPHKGRKASNQYREVVQTKLARGRNDGREYLPFVPLLFNSSTAPLFNHSFHRPTLSTRTES